MATSKNLRGFLPARKLGSGANSTGMSELPIASGLAANIFTGDTVHVTLGNVEPVTVGGTSALDAPIVVGVFQVVASLYQPFELQDFVVYPLLD